MNVITWLLPPLYTGMHQQCITPLAKCSGCFWKGSVMVLPCPHSIPYSQKVGKQWVCMLCNSVFAALQKLRGENKKPGRQGWDNLQNALRVLARSLANTVPQVWRIIYSLSPLDDTIDYRLTLFLENYIKQSCNQKKQRITLWWIRSLGSDGVTIPVSI